MGTTPCHRSPNPAFTNLTHAHARSIRAAVTMCEHCPIRQACARDALTAGTSLDGMHVMPANDVVQGGVECWGDLATAAKLATVAGVRELPTYAEQERRAVAPDACVSCGMPMVRWGRYEVPEGYVLHYARGYCAGCRKAYAEHMKSQPKRQRGLRKSVDRRRRSAPPRKNREAVIQLTLFDRDLTKAE